MTKQEYLEIQSEALAGEKQLKSILAERKVPYSTYNYWRNRFTSKNDKLPVTPISIKESNVAESHSTYIKVFREQVSLSRFSYRNMNTTCPLPSNQANYSLQKKFSLLRKS